MMSTSAAHAVKAVRERADLGEGRFAGAVALAQKTGAPPNYLSKLLQILARQGILESRKGAGGGFRLARDAREIRLYEIVAAIEDIDRWRGCFLGNGRCVSMSVEGDPKAGCAVHQRWAPVRDAYLALLHDSSVAEIG